MCEVEDWMVELEFEVMRISVAFISQPCGEVKLFYDLQYTNNVYIRGRSR